jgi:hypothetical protein
MPILPDEVKEFAEKYFKEHKFEKVKSKAEVFDDYCSAFVEYQMSKQKDRCLKERYDTWLMLLGFIGGHLKWFALLKEMSKAMGSEIDEQKN